MADSKDKNTAPVVPSEGAQVTGSEGDKAADAAPVYIVNGVKVDPNGKPVK